MLNSKSFLCIDFGAGSVKAAEFDQNESGAVRLLQFAIKPLGLAGSQESARERTVLRAIQEILAEYPFGSRNINVCAPGFHVFSKFVKLPPVDTSKITQIIQYEAQQNVPFPLDEVVWDYQILGTMASGELEVLLVAIKSDIVEGLFRTSETSGLRLNIVDVSPAALCNAFRFNYGEVEESVMLLDIGAKTSNLLFFEKGKVYSRSINIGANSITQDFAANARLPFPEAEQIKIADGFVSLGGAYAEPENPNQATISKIARQVMTRLHIQVNQTIQFYRGQQGGTAPQRLYLAGGASIMPYTAQFFAEKLNVAVEYFNPFRNVQIDPSVDLETLAGVAHSFGEVVGLGLRSVAQCPVELNLIPKSIQKRQQFSQKKPYFIAAVFSLVAVVFAFGWFFSKVEAVTEEALGEVEKRVTPLKNEERSLQKEENAIRGLDAEIDEYTSLLRQRLYWVDLFDTMRQSFLDAEAAAKQRLGVETGIWIESFDPDIPGEEDASMMYGSSKKKGESDNPFSGYDEAMMERYGLKPDLPSANTGAVAAEVVNTNELSKITLSCRAINHKALSPSANDEQAYILETVLKNNEFFSGEGTKLTGQLEQVDNQAPHFGFEITLKLAEPIKLK